MSEYRHRTFKNVSPSAPLRDDAPDAALSVRDWARRHHVPAELVAQALKRAKTVGEAKGMLAGRAK